MSALPDCVLVAPSRLRQSALAGRLQASLALDACDVDEAMQLHWRVLGGGLHGPSAGDRVAAGEGLAARSHYLLVRERGSRGVVGACRVRRIQPTHSVSDLQAARAFRFDRLDALDGGLIELGRICIEPDRPSGPVIRMLWQALARYMAGARLRHVIGCVSVPIDDGGHYAASLYRTLARRHLVESPLRAWPRNRLPIEALFNGCDPVLPPQLVGYLRAGAVLLGEPHADRDSAGAELPLWLDRKRVLPRALRRFIPQPRSTGVRVVTLLSS